MDVGKDPANILQFANCLQQIEVIVLQYHGFAYSNTPVLASSASIVGFS